MEFESIPGVGAKTASALADHEGAERALREGDVAHLASTPGISEGRADRIARGAVRKKHDDSSKLLRTDRAREIYRELLSLLKERAVTSYAKRRLETFYPSASSSRIEEVQAFATQAIEHEPDPGVREALAGVAPLDTAHEVRVRDRCLVTNDAETLAAAREAVPELPIEVVEDARGLADLARGYSTVIALDETFVGVEVDGDVQVAPAIWILPVISIRSTITSLDWGPTARYRTTRNSTVFRRRFPISMRASTPQSASPTIISGRRSRSAT